MDETAPPIGSLPPVGSVMAYMGSQASLSGTGWYECNGQYLSQASYARLYALIGTTYDTSPPSGKFRLPDLQGQFLRGVDNGTPPNDPDRDKRICPPGNTGKPRLPGSVQDDAFASHTHPNYAGYHQVTSMSANNNCVSQDEGMGAATGATGDSTETRPTNVYVYWIIKAA